MFRSHALALLLAAGVAVAAAPALADKGGSGKGPSDTPAASNAGGNGNGNDAGAPADKGGNGNGNGHANDTSVQGQGGGNGNGNKPGSGTSSIAIATVTGPSLAPASDSMPGYGDSMTFATTVERLAGWEHPMVGVTCYQDVNGDGTVDTGLFGPDIVFGLLDHPDATFTFAGSSLWAQRGGDATCRADLYAYGWKGGQQSIRLLATTGDWPTG